MALRIFSRNQSLRSPANMLIMNLAFSDLLLSITLIPECVYSFFCGGPWQFGYWGCQIHSFCGALCGYSQITTLTSNNQLLNLTIYIFSVVYSSRLNINSHFMGSLQCDREWFIRKPANLL